jgi:hypothetical protein
MNNEHDVELITQISERVRKACFDGFKPNLFEICCAFSFVLSATEQANELAAGEEKQNLMAKLVSETIRETMTSLMKMAREDEQ